MLKNTLKRKQGMQNRRTENNKKNRSLEETGQVANTESRLQLNHINNFFKTTKGPNSQI